MYYMLGVLSFSLYPNIWFLYLDQLDPARKQKWSAQWYLGVRTGNWATSTEMQKVNTFTRATFLGSKNLHQNCVIHDKFSGIKSAWIVTFQCETPGNRVKQSQTETLLVSSCCHKHLTFIYTTLHNILHQDFYPSWEIFTRALLAPLAPFCISEAIKSSV